MVVIMWLSKIDGRLIEIVKHEYANDLRTGTTLFGLMPRIAKSVDSLLGRYENSNLFRSSLALNETKDDDDTSTVRRFSKKTSFPKRRQLSSPVCSHCTLARKLLSAPELRVDHKTADCTRDLHSTGLRKISAKEEEPQGDIDREDPVPNSHIFQTLITNPRTMTAEALSTAEPLTDQLHSNHLCGLQHTCDHGGIISDIDIDIEKILLFMLINQTVYTRLHLRLNILHLQ